MFPFQDKNYLTFRQAVAKVIARLNNQILFGTTYVYCWQFHSLEFRMNLADFKT